MSKQDASQLELSYQAKDYSHLKGLKGITDEQISEHLKLYQGYVNRTNALLKRIEQMRSESRQMENSYQELVRRLGWEFNGMRLHEYYFDHLAPGGRGELSEANLFGAKVAKQFGSIQAWRDDFFSTAKMPGIGWLICYLDEKADRLFHSWIEQHEGGHPAGCKPLLVLDCFEHAFSVYLKPTERAKYIEDFFANVDWEAVARNMSE